ncbi:MAG TPA: cytochrome C oxidase Cbb3, partial [Hyphomicrobiales bacterium]|nr:cytochrome C oxidase Cbb3 [Hyphomicrobiales bacterium]
QGAPALNDAIWLYEDTVEAIAGQIRNPRHGVMPAWAGRLEDTTIKQLALYVHSLGGGE